MTDLHDDDGTLLRVLIGITAADELDSEEGLASLSAGYQRLVGRGLDEGTLAAEREQARTHGAEWLEAARELGRRLDDEAKQAVLAVAFEVAFADGFVLDEEDRVLATLAAALGLHEAEYRQTVERLLAAAHGS